MYIVFVVCFNNTLSQLKQFYQAYKYTYSSFYFTGRSFTKAGQAQGLVALSHKNVLSNAAHECNQTNANRYKRVFQRVYKRVGLYKHVTICNYCCFDTSLNLLLQYPEAQLKFCIISTNNWVRMFLSGILRRER